MYFAFSNHIILLCLLQNLFKQFSLYFNQILCVKSKIVERHIWYKKQCHFPSHNFLLEGQPFPKILLFTYLACNATY